MSIDPFRQCDEMHRGAATKVKKKKKKNTDNQTLISVVVFHLQCGCLTIHYLDVSYIFVMICIGIYNASFNVQCLDLVGQDFILCSPDLWLKGGRVGVLSRLNCISGALVFLMDNQIALAEVPELLWLLQQILWALRTKLCGSGPNPTYGNPWVVVPEDDRATASTAEPSRPSAAAADIPAASTSSPVVTPAPVDTSRICYNTCLFCDSRCCRGEEVGHRHCRCRVHKRWRQ